MSEFQNAQRFDLHVKGGFVGHPVSYFEPLANGAIRCTVCPRRCHLAEGKFGFCKVRRNDGGQMKSLNYGKACRISTERIETEAVFHYRPGSAILAIGNFGCNLDCSYCQNWKFSRFEYTPPSEIHDYTTEQIIETAIAQGVDTLSWTYNDPAVWPEFVIETAKAARKRGLRNLFKSAMFLNPEVVEDLCEVMDVFAVSIKAIDEDYYREFTTGTLAPVLRNAEIIHRSGIHCEVSNLVVTDLTNNQESYDRMIDFMLKRLSPDVPLHFTRFHPDYKYTHVGRTPVADVEAAARRALELGVRYAYVGNVFASDFLNTKCHVCGTTLVSRVGLESIVHPECVNEAGVCAQCGSSNNLHLK